MHQQCTKCTKNAPKVHQKCTKSAPKMHQKCLKKVDIWSIGWLHNFPLSHMCANLCWSDIKPPPKAAVLSTFFLCLFPMFPRWWMLLPLIVSMRTKLTSWPCLGLSLFLQDTKQSRELWKRTEMTWRCRSWRRCLHTLPNDTPTFVHDTCEHHHIQSRLSQST